MGENWRSYINKDTEKELFMYALSNMTPEQKYDMGIMPKDIKYKEFVNTENGVHIWSNEYKRGVYMIHSFDYAFIYISSSNNIDQRWYYAVMYLKENKFHSKLVQQAWNKYSELYIDILEECSLDVLKHVKKKWCKQYNLSTSKKAFKCNQEIDIEGYVDKYKYDIARERRIRNGWQPKRNTKFTREHGLPIVKGDIFREFI